MAYESGCRTDLRSSVYWASSTSIADDESLARDHTSAFSIEGLTGPENHEPGFPRSVLTASSRDLALPFRTGIRHAPHFRVHGKTKAP